MVDQVYSIKMKISYTICGNEYEIILAGTLLL